MWVLMMHDKCSDVVDLKTQIPFSSKVYISDVAERCKRFAKKLFESNSLPRLSVK